MSVVTLLFTDLVSSTPFLSQLRDEAAEDFRRAHFRLLREAIALHGGEEVKTLGDGLMVAFESPGEAVACAVTMQQAVDRRNRAADGEALQIRIGIDIGEPTRQEGDYFGTPVVIASRLCATAEGGQILVSEVVRAIVASRGFTFKSLGALPLKGIDDPVPTCEVTWEPAAPAIALPTQFAQQETMPFVGRDSDRERLRKLYAEARSGSRRLVMLVGDPGIGKTRFAGELAREVHLDGATVLYGRSEEEGLVPYQPFVEAFGHYIESVPPETLEAQTRSGASDLARLLPQLAERLPGLAEPLRAEPETERYRLFDAVASLLTAAADEAPVVLVLDDLHWSDKPTLLLLKHVLRSVDRARLLIIGGYRDVELDRQHPLAETLADLRRDESYERVLLRGLTREEVAAVLEARTGQELDAPAQALADALHRETEGNPFFIREIIRHLVETGAIYLEDGRWTSHLTVEQVGLPEGVKEVIGRRLSRLSDECNEAMRVASVIGREFDLQLLERVSGIAGERLLEALEQATAARVLGEVPDALDRYAFAHALVRETLYEELTTSRRVRLHHRVGEAIELIRGDDPDALAELAHHFGEAAAIGDPEKAVNYAMRAGHRASELLAYEEAASLIQRGLQTLEQEGPPDEARRLEMLLALGEARRRAGDFPDSKEAFRNAAEIARARADAHSLATAALGYGGLWVDVGVVDPFLVGLIEECLAGDVADVFRSRLLARLAMELAFTDDVERKRGHSEEAVTIARRSGDWAALAYALTARRHAVAGPADIEERLEITAEAIRVAGEAGELEYAQRARALRLIDLLECGEIEEADREYEAFDHATEELRQPFYRYVALLFANERALREGRLEEADQKMTSLWRAGEQIGRFTSRLAISAQEFLVKWMRGGLADHNLSVLRVLEPARNLLPFFTISWSLVQARMGRLDEARTSYEGAADALLGRPPTEWDFSIDVGYLSELALRFDDRSRMPAIYDLLSSIRPANLLAAVTAPVAYWGPATLSLGMLATRLGRFDEAERDFGQALTMAERMRAVPVATQVRVEHARMLAERGEAGDRERAAELLDLATQDAERIGFVPMLEDARVLRASL